MSLKEKLVADMKEAMKAKEEGRLRLGVIRLVCAAIRQQEIDGHRNLDDDAVLTVIEKGVKQRRDSIAEFQKGGRDDLVRQHEAEIAVLMAYLPQQMTEDDVRSAVREAIAATGASSPKEMGKVMKELMPKVKGRADGRLVNQIVRELLDAGE